VSLVLPTRQGGRRALACAAVVFDWAYVDAHGDEVGRSPLFPDASSAEEWLSTSWADLLEMGVEEVRLHDHEAGRNVYRMGLGGE